MLNDMINIHIRRLSRLNDITNNMKIKWIKKPPISKNVNVIMVKHYKFQ